MSDQRLGVISMVLVCVIWGLSPLYYHLLAHIPPILVLAHRTIWSLVFFLLILFGQGRLPELGAALTSRKLCGWIFLAALLISVNWFMFITAVSIGQTVEAALGYYIFPLVAVGLGAVFLRERLSPAQWLAVTMAAGAVVFLMWCYNKDYT